MYFFVSNIFINLYQQQQQEQKNKYNKLSLQHNNPQEQQNFKMQQSATDIDRKLAIYYHPLFQQAINLLTDLLIKADNEDGDKQQYKEQKKAQNQKTFSLGLMEFIEFNLKLQKCLLPTFQAENAIISGLNDWVKEVAECLNFDGMIITTQCEEINDSNFESLLRTQIVGSKMQLYEATQKYIRTLSRLKNHDAFKLLGVKINKEVFSKFMFDLCSTWCEFLDIEMFVYFLLAVYMQISEGPSLNESRFKSTHMIQTIDLEFMEQFEQIKQNYAKNKKKELRYYRAWCEWNYLRVGEVGQGLILCLDSILQDNRVLEIALVFQRAIKVINEQITSQSQQQSPQDTITLKQKEYSQKDFLIMKKLQTKQNKTSLQNPPALQNRQKSIQITNENKTLEDSIPEVEKSKPTKNVQKIKSLQREGSIRIHSRNQTISEDQLQQKKVQQNLMQVQHYISESAQMYDESYQHHDFQIEIDELGNMYLKRVVKLPILGFKIDPMQFEKKRELQMKWIEKKRKECRQVSNLYRRLENMKVRLEHNVKNDHYSFKKNPRIAERDRFYQNAQQSKPNQTYIRRQAANKQQPIFQKSIHQKLKPQQGEENISRESAKPFAKQEEYMSMRKTQQQTNQIRKNDDYIHKVIAPSFLTDQRNNISYSEKEGSIYGIGAQEQRRDIKLNLPKIKFMRDYKVKEDKSYHIIGKLTKDRNAINERVKSMSMVQDSSKQTKPLGILSDQDKIDQLKNDYHHIWNRYINEQQINELTNYADFYQQLEKCKQTFSRQYESEYRKNLKPIFLYENKRYEMGGMITRQEEERFYEKMKKLINRDERRKKKKEKKLRFRQYKKSFKNKNQRSFFEDVFINHHKNQIKHIKEQRARIRSQIIQMSSTAH